tara:strand:- start:657 stop:848 length:192 start_codon:yes stop_codon:yes gene_type:complete
VPTYKVVVEVESDFGLDEVNTILERLFEVPARALEEGRTFNARLLASAETQASRSGRTPGEGQ